MEQLYAVLFFIPISSVLLSFCLPELEKDDVVYLSDDKETARVFAGAEENEKTMEPLKRAKRFALFCCKV